MFSPTAGGGRSTSERGCTVRAEIRWLLRLRYGELSQVCIEACEYHIQKQLYVHSDLPKADLQKVFANKIKRVQTCIDGSGRHFQQLL
jgi:hypothetical protein